MAFYQYVLTSNEQVILSMYMIVDNDCYIFLLKENVDFYVKCGSYIVVECGYFIHNAHSDIHNWFKK